MKLPAALSTKTSQGLLFFLLGIVTVPGLSLVGLGIAPFLGDLYPYLIMFVCFLCFGGLLGTLVLPWIVRYPLAAVLVFIGLVIVVVGTRQRSPSHDCSTTQGSRIYYNDKPVIYLYPQRTQAVTVKLSLIAGTLSASYPEFDQALGGWSVIATRNGKLTDRRDGKEYSYLFWESMNTSDVNYDLSKGFVVKGAEVRDFLHTILPKTGLTPKEYNEFIVYWYPRLMNIPLMQVYFAGTEYTDSAPLSIEPRPDSLLRVFMVVRPLKEPITLIPQKIPSFERKGFSVVEWGGALLP